MAPPVSFTGKKSFEVQFSDDFRVAFLKLDEAVQDKAAVVMNLLEMAGPALVRPYADKLDPSGHAISYADPRELRWREQRNEWRALYVWQGKAALMLAVGQKAGNENRFYKQLFADGERAWTTWKKRGGK